MSVKRKVTVPVGRSLTTQGFRVLVTGANRNLDPAGPVDPVLDEYRPPPCGGAGPQFPSRQQKKQPFAASSWFQVSPLTDSNRRPLLTMEGWERQARARAVIRERRCPANPAFSIAQLCPRVP